MFLERARVVAVDRETVWVVPDPGSGCGVCRASGGCGLLLLGRWRRQRCLAVAVRSDMPPVAVHDRVMIGIDGRRLLDDVIRTLGIPMGAMLLVGSASDLLLQKSEPITALAAALGLFVGFCWVKLDSRRFRRTPVPILWCCSSSTTNDNATFSS